MNFTQPATTIIPNRFSCRVYKKAPISEEKIKQLVNEANLVRQGPFGTPLRFAILAASENDREELRGLGTYGAIRNPMGYIAGAIQPGPKNLEDFGFIMEELVLLATDLGLGTCWLGGNLTQSSFASKIQLQGNEILPAVVSMGEMVDARQPVGNPSSPTQRKVNRLPWQDLFFDGDFSTPLNQEKVGVFASVLEMTRLSPSASNKQPCRIIRDGQKWHFYMERTPGYKGGILMILLKVKDLQRVDMGIAMSHFELSAKEMGLSGGWTVDEPAIQKPGELTEYVSTWIPK